MNHRIFQSVVMIFFNGVASGLDVVQQLALFDFVLEVTCKESEER